MHPSGTVAELQDADIALNYGIFYREIGNEICGNGYYPHEGWEYDLHVLDQTAADRVGNPVLSTAAYGTHAAAFLRAMKLVRRMGLEPITRPL